MSVGRKKLGKAVYVNFINNKLSQMRETNFFDSLARMKLVSFNEPKKTKVSTSRKKVILKETKICLRQ